jgi:hypothetical protein
VQLAPSPSPGGGGPARYARRGGVKPNTPQMFQRRSIKVARAVNGGMNGVEHAVKIFGNIVVPKSNDTIAFRFQPARSLVVLDLVRCQAMLRTIKLDQQSRCHAGKIGNVWSDRNLTTEVRAACLKRTKVPPQHHLRVCCVEPQPASCFASEAINRLLVCHCPITPPRRLRRRPSPSRGGWTRCTIVHCCLRTVVTRCTPHPRPLPTARSARGGTGAERPVEPTVSYDCRRTSASCRCACRRRTTPPRSSPP